ncbi:sigma 54-interacting transcriptional regulator [Blattabacterium sp. (Cryptocercus punctulatus) str. Cpu]|uniref:sigma 54-interacting transcriptional regulator n=1 Tax=Blattabacterium sp. (Cryptocercus punctulatus) str. Cpu TaxID=1075399 RepID=UPI00023872A8|nr:sigma-54 dependent transcriptional regulator [Blattabacterium sp. (Cryptocercus punctulatus) str. Cpu]AEU09251.1 sigma-54-dependent transcriptional regulator [Blattabacterium sp. (Cryptocercus punctulatus) str. Cpu]
MESIHNIKKKFSIIGNDYALHRALEKTIQVAPTDISVLVLGESGVGKEFIPKIIHQFSYRKHHSYIAVNCGAIPEGTIDSELFGHEKGSFTGATNMRKGYFEGANGGTIFLDEVGELPLTTQVRLLRILETGEFIKVGSSKIQKTNIRIVAATNLNLLESIQKGKFREDLYYRLNTVQINLPPLRFRKNDIKLLFKKFSNDFSDKYHIPSMKLTEDAIIYLEKYPWPGNIRQLKNIIEQMSVIEKKREISSEKLKEYIPENIPFLSFSHPINNEYFFQNFSNERDFLYKILFDMKKSLNHLKNLTLQLIKNNNDNKFIKKNQELMEKVFGKIIKPSNNSIKSIVKDSIFQLENSSKPLSKYDFDYEEIEEDVSKKESNSFSLQKKEIEFIKKALKKNNGKRKKTAIELGISERTLYRKIKQYGL